MGEEILTRDFVFFNDIVDENTGEVIVAAGSLLTEILVTKILSLGIKEINIVKDSEKNPVIYKTILVDNTHNEESALYKIYALIRPSEKTTISFKYTLEIICS